MPRQCAFALVSHVLRRLLDAASNTVRLCVVTTVESCLSCGMGWNTVRVSVSVDCVGYFDFFGSLVCVVNFCNDIFISTHPVCLRSQLLPLLDLQSC